MTADDLARLALGLPAVTEESSFGPSTRVFKIAGKVFAILEPNRQPPRITVKCDPDFALDMRARFPAVTPGYHVNKRLWNSVVLDGSVPKNDLTEMVSHAYYTVFDALPERVRSALADS